jgi:hypothetical protein
LVPVFKISESKNRQFKLYQKPQKVGKLHEGIIKRKPLSGQLFDFLQLLYMRTRYLIFVENSGYEP